jgi:predicted MFS family arabinose efflux permease
MSIRHDPYAALRTLAFRRLVAANTLATIGEQMLGVALGWELYARTGSPLALGLVGLAQIVPVLALSLPAGQLADRHDRRQLAAAASALIAACAIGLATLSLTRGPLVLVYGCVVGVGAARALLGPASAALLPQLVPAEHRGNAAAWNSSAWQSASIAGPALAGLLIGASGTALPAYAAVAAIAMAVGWIIAHLPPRPIDRLPDPPPDPPTARSLLSGLRFVWSSRVLLAALTLDLVAVLLGGATALLPIYAADILHVGAVGLGALRAAPAIGAVAAGVIAAHRPSFQRPGRALLLAVAGFGAATVGFGASRSLGLSLAMLVALGACDNVSVVIRTTLELARTPDALRGQVGAVHAIFVGLSSELGALESGVAAQLVGAVSAVVIGGAGTLAVVIVVALAWPELRRLRELS